MRKLVWVFLLMMVLTACGEETEPVFETIGEVEYDAVSAEPAPVSVWVPEDAVAEAMADETAGECYVWENCELRVETVAGGDIRRTMENLTGISAENLTVMEYERGGIQIYQTVWSTTGEEGIFLGRAMVADDGNYHYCVSLLSPETEDVDETYAQICASFSITGEDAGK